MNVTRPQRKMLIMMVQNGGRIEHIGPRNIFWHNKDQMMQRLCQSGHIRSYVHGGYEITDAGRSALTSPVETP